MGSSEVADRDGVSAALDRFRASCAEMAELNFDVLTTPERLAVLQGIETGRRQLPVAEHQLITQLADQSAPEELGGPVHSAIADRLHITPAEARRRVRDAHVLGPRTALTGEPLEPACRPSRPPKPPARSAPSTSARSAGSSNNCRARSMTPPARTPKPPSPATPPNSPRRTARGGRRMAAHLNPDGLFTDADRARKRGVIIGAQDIDGMSPISGHLTPEARATLDAVLAKWAAPGMCNPDDHTPVVDGAPTEDAIHADRRSRGQRNHDALHAACRSILSSGQLGHHHGLPATVVVSTSLAELQSGTGSAITGAGTTLPMADVIRLASHAHHYLVVFDEHDARPLYLGHAKRIATADQRIVLHAKDRGCTYPGCTVPGYLCEVHHVEEFAAGGPTDIDNLTYACGPHHRLLDKGWKTRKRHNGTTEWIPPPTSTPENPAPTATTTPSATSTKTTTTTTSSGAQAHGISLRAPSAPGTST